MRDKKKTTSALILNETPSAVTEVQGQRYTHTRTHTNQKNQNVCATTPSTRGDTSQEGIMMMSTKKSTQSPSRRPATKATGKKEPAVTRGGKLVEGLVSNSKGEALPSQKVDGLPFDFVAVNKAPAAQQAPNQLVRLTVRNLPKDKPNFAQPGTTKDGLIAEWLAAWIQAGLSSGKLTECHLLPRKAEIAQYLGVSIGTIQNAIRFVEDEGHVESKQRIGTVLRNAATNRFRLRKQTSKRDKAVEAIQLYIHNKNLQPDSPMPSARELARVIGSAPNTTRLALEYLASKHVLQSQGVRGNKVNWYVADPTLIDPSVLTGGMPAIASETLIDQIERDLKQLIANEYQVNDKLPSHLELADKFRVSIKTIHDAMRRLVDQTIVYSKRGRYGTYVARQPGTEGFFSAEDAEFFTPVEEAGFYNYQRIEQQLKQYIVANHKVSDRLPPMGELASQLQVSSNTVRKALQELASQGYVQLSRGRYGGTFVVKLPQDVELPQADAKAEAPSGNRLLWVSVNPKSAAVYQNDTTRRGAAPGAKANRAKATNNPAGVPSKGYNSVSQSIVMLSQRPE